MATPGRLAAVYGHRRFLFDLGSTADDPTAGATQYQGLVSVEFSHQLGQVGVVRRVFRRCENNHEVCCRVAHVLAYGSCAFGESGAQAVLLG